MLKKDSKDGDATEEALLFSPESKLRVFSMLIISQVCEDNK